MSNERTLAMFPLGTVVFPGQILPLHVFEDRYRTLMRELTEPDADPTFGTALIDRGHEVGGGDHRVSIGTRMQIVEAEMFDDGRWGMLAAGLERVQIVRWLDDDPYPRAVVVGRDVADTGGADLDVLESAVRETLSLAAKYSGSEASPSIDFSGDPMVRLDQMAAVAPLEHYDRQRILEAGTTSELTTLLGDALEERQLILRAQLGTT